jgi:hypothetical protein
MAEPTPIEGVIDRPALVVPAVKSPRSTDEPNENVALAEGLFVSHLQASEILTADTVRAVIAATLERHGHTGCAALVAYEFGEHPDDSARRMAWARRAVQDTLAVSTPRSG